jgi:hypothetical protein
MVRLRSLIGLGLMLMLSGCAGYKLGPTNGQVAGAKSVQVNPFLNETMQPQLGDDVTNQVRKQIQRNGTFHLSNDDGDIVVSGVLISYVRIPLAFQPSDALTVTDYSVRVLAQVTAKERSTGKVLLSQPVSGTTLVIVGGNLDSAERQARPLLAADLAKNVTALLAEGSW